MISEQASYKSRMMVALMVVVALWATVAFAGVDEDFFEAVKRGDLPAAESSIANGADVNAKDEDGRTALIIASGLVSRNGCKEVIQALLATGADVNAKTNDGLTALMAASVKGHKEIVQALLDKGADVNAKRNDGVTALMLSSVEGHKEIVQALLAKGIFQYLLLAKGKGADVNAKDNYGDTALDIASRFGQQEVKELLIGAGAKITNYGSNAAPPEVSKGNSKGHFIGPSHALSDGRASGYKGMNQICQESFGAEAFACEVQAAMMCTDALVPSTLVGATMWVADPERVWKGDCSNWASNDHGMKGQAVIKITPLGVPEGTFVMALGAQTCDTKLPVACCAPVRPVP